MSPSGSASARRRRESSPGALVLLATLVAFAGASPARADVEASFDAARLKDDLAGTISDPADEIRIGFRVLSDGRAKLSATLGPDTRSSETAATGLTLSLATKDGTPLGPFTSLPFAGGVRWRNVPVAATGEYVLTIRAATAGTWRLQLSGVHTKLHYEDTSPGLPPQGEDDVEFTGLARGTASWVLDREGSGAKFVGEAVRIEQPDGTDLPGVTETATGRITLQQDGVHRFVFRNAGTSPNDARARVDVKPPKVLKRTGFVEADGTALVPVVTKVDPPKGFHRDDALPLTITGRDFQDGCDVRLFRGGRTILGTSIVVVSESEVACFADLDTQDDPGHDGETSVGTWTVGVWNAPEYGTPDDRSTLVTDSRTKNTSKTFQSLSSASISLPSGVMKGSEVWYLDFNDDFQSDLNAMGLGSNDETVREAMRTTVQAYTVLFLREYFRCNETTGGLVKDKAVPISFTVVEPSRVAGEPGVDYNRIEIGGRQEDDDVHDPAEPLAWGASGLAGQEIDVGNERRDDLSVLDAGGARVGLGARTAVLDPRLSVASASWQTAMQPLRSRPLTAADRIFFQGRLGYASQTERDRYEEVVAQTTRAAREIAAILAHHIGKAMGVEDVTEGAQTGPMSNVAVAGDLFAKGGFTSSEITTLRTEAVPHALPGVSRGLRITYFPMIARHAYRYGYTTNEQCVTSKPYSARFQFVGGRPNARKDDWRVQYVVGSALPRGLTLSFDGLDGTAPLWVDQTNNVFYWGVLPLKIAVTDKVRGGTRFYQFRIDVEPDVTKLPPALQTAGNNAIQTVRSTP